jgi:hypothetical protein
LDNAGVASERRPSFIPHATIAYGVARLPQSIVIAPVAWKARELALLVSHVGQAHHEVLGQWDLR